MSFPLTLRDRIRKTVADNADRTGRPVTAVWRDLYEHFGWVHNFAVARAAYNAGYESKIQYLEDRGLLGELDTIATEYLSPKPALPENEKAPGQGSFQQGEK